MRLTQKTILWIERGLSRKTDKPRWNAAIHLGEYCKSDPQAVWQLAVKWGSVPNADTRAAIATCVLEHLLEYQFDPYFRKTVSEVKNGNKRLGDTLRSCWQFGEANSKRNGQQFDLFRKWFDR